MDHPSHPNAVNDDSNTAQKERKPRSLGVPFVKGDPRINRKGRPRTFDELRKLAQDLAHSEIKTGKMKGMTVATAILASWAASREPTLQKAFIEYAYGKVSEKLETEHTEKAIILVKHSHERTEENEQQAPRHNGHIASLS
jgi:hypothetical protein